MLNFKLLLTLLITPTGRVHWPRVCINMLKDYKRLDVWKLEDEDSNENLWYEDDCSIDLGYILCKYLWHNHSYICTFITFLLNICFLSSSTLWRAHVHTYVHTYVAYVHTYICMYVQCTYVNTYIHTYMHSLHTYSTYLRLRDTNHE